MAHIREETLNTYLALLLDSYEGITATAEKRSSTEAIDITVVHGAAVEPIPILVEAKIGDTPSKRREAVRQARSRLAAPRRASLAFGLCYPIHLRDGAVSAQARRTPSPSPSSHSRPCSVSGERIRGAKARSPISPTVYETPICPASLSLMPSKHRPQGSGHAPRLRLRSGSCKRAGSPQEEQRSPGRFTRSGTDALQCGTAPPPLRLVPSLAGIVKLKTALGEPTKTPTIIREAWQAILSIDFHPVFAPALAALKVLNDDDAREPMRWVAENAVAVADELASLRFDHAGSLYHRLLATAKYDGSFYTNNVFRHAARKARTHRGHGELV